MSETISIKDFCLLRTLEQEDGIECLTEIEDGYLAVCGKFKKILIYSPKEYTEKIITIEDKEIINYIIYTKRKHLISATDEDIKIFNINLQNKSYNLIQVLNCHKNLTLKLLELSNGKLASSAYDSKIIIYDFKENKYEKEFSINFGTKGIECIIETTNKEICGSSTYDYIIGFWSILNYKNITLNHPVNGGTGALSMASKELMAVLNILEHGFSLINVFSHQIVQTFSNKEKLRMSYLLHLSDGSNLIAYQEPWKKYVYINDGPFGCNIPDKNKTKVYLRQFSVIKEPKELAKEKIIKINNRLYTEHNEDLCSMIELKDHKIVTACFQGGLASQFIETTKSSVQIFDDINKIIKIRNAKIVFNFNGKEISYEYKYDTNMEIVIDTFLKENGFNLNEIYLEYNGKELVSNITINNLADIEDKKNNIINIFVSRKRDLNELISEYDKKINYKFNKYPEFNFNKDIINSDSIKGNVDIFEVYLSHKNNEEYLVLAINENNYNFELDIYNLLYNKKIISLKGHKSLISSVQYFINEFNKNEYLISSDKKGIVIIWDLSNNYEIKYKLESDLVPYIYSCLLIFPQNDLNYIIVSTSAKVECDEDEEDQDLFMTNIYHFNNGKFKNFIEDSCYNSINCLLSWKNKEDNKLYIIQLGDNIISIYNLEEDKLQDKLENEKDECDYTYGYIYENDNKNYLCCSSLKGNIYIWDLNNKSLFKDIPIENSQLYNIIQWNSKYTIVADVNKSFRVVDIEEGKIIFEVKDENSGISSYIKKINHPIYGESLLSNGYSNSIKLWTI